MTSVRESIKSAMQQVGGDEQRDVDNGGTGSSSSQDRGGDIHTINDVQERRGDIEAQRAGRWEADKSDRATVRATIEKEYAAAKQKSEEESEFESALDARRELRERSGVALPDLVKGYAGLHELAKSDPRRAVDLAVDYGLRNPGNKVTPQTETDGPRTVRSDIEKAFAAVRASDEDRAAVPILKQVAPHQSAAKTLREIADFDRALREDPMGAAARQAARAGMPVTPFQQERAGRLNDAQQLVDHIRSSGALPNFAQLEDAIAEVIEDPAFPSTGDPRRDLGLAFCIAEEQAVAAAKRKAAVSIKGAPSGGASVRNSNSARADIERAMEQLR